MGLCSELSIEPGVFVEKIVDFIQKEVAHLQRDGVVFGLSGGIDSAVICALSARAVGPDRCLGLIMPERDSDVQSQKDGELVAQVFEVRTEVVDLAVLVELYGAYELVPSETFSKRHIAEKIVRGGYKLFPQNRSPFFGSLLGTRVKWLRGPTAFYRIKHRLRAVTLYYYAEVDNLLVVGSNNRSESLTGFFVKHGDSSADIMPLTTLFKTQVRELAKWLGIPDRILEKPPTPDLIPGLTDELVLGISYEKLDPILNGLEKGMNPREIAKELRVGVKTVKYVEELVRRSEHMRNLPVNPEIWRSHG